MRSGKTLLAIILLVLVVALLPTVAHATPTTLDDGDYLVEVRMEGGSGRAHITSPTSVSVVQGKTTATIEWSSPNYDYMVVDGSSYIPTNHEGNSTFQIPVLAFDEPFEVVGDTTAMSTPHEITYTLTFDSSTAQRVQDNTTATVVPVAIAIVVCGALATIFVVRRVSRKRPH